MHFPSHLRWLCHTLSFVPVCALALVLVGCGAGAPQPSAKSAASSRSHSEPSLAPPIPGSYVALGASETYGVGATPHSRGYAYLLSQALHARHFLDVGIPGATIVSAYDTELTNALAARPSLCTVFFGVNDLRGGVKRDVFVQYLGDLVATLRRAHARVLIIGLPELSAVPAIANLRVGGLGRVVSSWNWSIRRMARQPGVTFLDLRAYGAELARHRNYIASDGLHPSNAGHARLAQLVEGSIRLHRLWRAS